jgi:hypothetical protein
MRACIVLLVLVIVLGTADARKVDAGSKANKNAQKLAEAAKMHDAAHARRKLKAYKSDISGRTGTVMDAPTPLAGRKLQQTLPTATTVAPGMTVCLPAGAQCNSRGMSAGDWVSAQYCLQSEGRPHGVAAPHAPVPVTCSRLWRNSTRRQPHLLHATAAPGS